MTGHDTDLHCSGGQQCHFFEVAVNYVRGGAPDPSKPVLVLDRPASDDPGSPLDVPTAFENAFGPGVVPQVVMDPRSAEFASAPLTTDNYSAIVVASDITCGGCDLNEFSGGGGSETPDSDAINARQADIETFFNQGGGIFANAGGDHADGDASTGPDVYYNFLPVPATGVAVNPPFCLTDDGIALGFEDQSCPDASKHNGTNDDINCCPTHNSFAEPPAGSPLKVSERDSEGFAETMFAEGRIFGGQFDNDPPSSTANVPSCTPTGDIGVTVTDVGSSGPKAVHFRIDGGAEQVVATDASGNAVVRVPNGRHSLEYWGEDRAGNQENPHKTASVNVDTTSRCAVASRPARPSVRVAGVRTRGCVRSSFRMSVRAGAAAGVRRVTVSLDGKRIRSTTRSRFRVRVNVRRLKAGRHTLRVIVTDRAGQRRATTRRFARCAQARRRVAPRFTG